MNSYIFSVSSDFGNQTVAIDRLMLEIRQSTISVALHEVSISDGNCVITFKVALSGAEETVLNNLVTSHSGVALPEPVDANGIPLVTFPSGVVPGVRVEGNIKAETVPTQGSRKTFITHNYANKTTWYTDSSRVVDETLTSDAGLEWNTVHKPIVDAGHGKIFGEHDLLDENGHSYRVAVTVNGVLMTEKDKHTGMGDYVVDYVNGKIIFDNSQLGNTVQVTYHKVNSSRFTVKPLEGKILTIGEVETQFSTDYNITDTTIFQPLAPVEKVAPTQAVSGGGSIPDGTLIPIASPTVYNTDRDFIRESNGAFPTIKKSASPDAIGNWRMMQNDVQGYPWRYKAGIVLKSSISAQIDIYLEHDEAFGGEEATATLYCLSEDEV